MLVRLVAGVSRRLAAGHPFDAAFANPTAVEQGSRAALEPAANRHTRGLGLEHHQADGWTRRILLARLSVGVRIQIGVVAVTRVEARKILFNEDLRSGVAIASQ